jgi:hypothetical protein
MAQERERRVFKDCFRPAPKFAGGAEAEQVRSACAQKIGDRPWFEERRVKTKSILDQAPDL